MTLGPVDVCEMAILEYKKANAKALGYPFRIDSIAHRTARAEAKALFKNGEEGIQYGAPGCPNTWLIYRDGEFCLLSADGEGEGFEKFLNFLTEGYEAAGLILHVMLPRRTNE